VLDRLGAIGGVDAAVVAQGLPPDGGGLTFGSGFQGEGRDPVGSELILPFGTVTSGYLETVGASLVGGRELTAEDVEAGGVLIDTDFARRLFGSTDVAGRRMRFGEDREWRPIVGVIDELRLGGVDDSMGDGALLYPLDREAPPRYLDFIVRTANPAELAASVRGVFHDVDDALPLLNLLTAQDAVREATVRPRFLVLLMTILAAVALSLAGLGIYGVLAYAVSRRRREIGIRIALGAASGQLRARIVGWGSAVAGVGVVLGLTVAMLLDDLAASLLFGIRPGDVTTRFLVVTSVAAVTVLACWIPSRRAARVDPLEALRAE